MNTVINERNASTQQKQMDYDAPIRPIPATKIANLKRKMKGAHRRVLRCSKEMQTLRDDINRKYFIRKAEDGSNEQHIPISSSEIRGLRLKRTMIEGELAEAKGEFFVADQEYRSATSHNFAWKKKANRRVWKDNRTRREARKLTELTLEILEKHGVNGEASVVTELKSLAMAGDVKGFRKRFDEKVSMWAPEHFETISGVSSVKTEILRALIEKYKSDQVPLVTPTDLTA